MDSKYRIDIHGNVYLLYNQNQFQNSHGISFHIHFIIFSEFYDDDKNLIDYNCPKKEDFIKKGIGMIIN